MVRYDPERLRLEKIIPGELFPKEPASVVFLPHIAEEQGIAIINAIRLESIPENTTGSTSLAYFDFARMESSSRNSITDLEIIFDLQASETGNVQRGLLQQEMTLIPVPTRFALYPNWPNPFNPETTITYDVAKEDIVRILIYNLSGQPIRTLVNRWHSTGTYSAIWDGKNESGQDVASGVFPCRMVTSEFVTTRKMMLVK